MTKRELSQLRQQAMEDDVMGRIARRILKLYRAAKTPAKPVETVEPPTVRTRERHKRSKSAQEKAL